MPAAIKLQNFGRVVAEFFGHTPYQVGSSLTHLLASTGGDWRDVDVRLILPDDEFDEMFGATASSNAKWNAACLAFSSLGREMTGLPIDFQVQQKTEANKKYGHKARSALVPATMTPASLKDFERVCAEEGDLPPDGEG